jgi:hypothetical protein
MLRFGSPAVLYAGLALALLPLLLHLIARRPADRRALPTARFLSPDPRTRPRLQRRPTDLPLLLVRTLFVLLVATAFARPQWLPARSGTVELLLLDAGSGMAPVWGEALQATRDRLPAAAGLLVFDTTARFATAGAAASALLDSLAAAGPATVEADYGAGLQGVQALVAALRAADSARLTLVTLPRWDAWGAGLAAVRAAAWPGRIEVVAPGRGAGAGGVAGRPATDGPAADATAAGAAAAGAPVPVPRGRASVPAVSAAGPDGGVYVAAALGALGWDVARNMLSDADLYVVLGAVPATTADALLERVRGGATAVVSGGAAGVLGGELPWRMAGGGGVVGAGADAPAAGDRVAGGDLLVGGGPRLRGAAGRYGGSPAEGARVLAAWDDGRAAAAAHVVGGGCLVYVATELEGGRLPLSPGFPEALERLAGGCAPDDGRSAAALAGWRAGTGPLDGGARALLAGAGATTSAALRALPAQAGGIRLFRWFVLAALVVALLEAVMAYGRTGRS